MITLGLLLMDLIAAWLIHYLEHHIKWMWKFHAVHHTDQHLDTTSGNRHHPGESVFRLAFSILAIWILGAPIWLVFIYQTLSVVLTQFNHSNIIIPKTLDKILSKFIVTPNMHQVHHHYRMPYSDSNYGNIFPFWDLIFNTYSRVDNDKIKYGLDTHMEPEFSNKIMSMLKMPFLPYRNKIVYQEEEEL
jgi:sterol desaturase/sphingolipid hydroxylase (fatty acid hydroxylase superfamily)